MNMELASPRVEGELRLARAMRRVATAIAAFMNYVAGWNFILCAVFVTIDVLCRNFGGFSSSATTEITSYMLAFGISWGLAHALATRSHIRIDVLVNRLPVGLRQYLHAFALALLTGLSLFIAWCAWHLVDESIFFNAKDTSALAIPLVIPQGLWADRHHDARRVCRRAAAGGLLPAGHGQRRRDRQAAGSSRLPGRDAGSTGGGRLGAGRSAEARDTQP